MNIVVVYVYPNMGGKHDSLAKRFFANYAKFFPAVEHELCVIANGGPLSPYSTRIVGQVKHRLLIHDDTGWDIGAYRKAAAEVPCDLMVFFGGTAYVRGPGWLERMVAAFQKHGRAIYGATGSLGHNIHIRTTGFWMPPDLMSGYPYETTSEKESRYEFEHGNSNLTLWVMSLGLKALVVTWHGEYEWQQWDYITNGFHNGNQSALIVGDRLTDPPYWPIRRKPSQFR